MLIRLIGPVTITTGDTTTRVSAPKRACVLAALAAEPNTPVSQTELIDRVWDGAPPETATSVLYSYIANLRAALKPSGTSIERAEAHGYMLAIDPDAVDLHRLRGLASRASAARGADALRLWRAACELADGEALAGLPGRWAAQFRKSFDDSRLGLLTSRYNAELAAGEHASVIDELSALVTAQPLAEPLTGQLMLALYRAGRGAEALRWFEATRVRLRDELGADPSAELRELHLRILAQSPQLHLSIKDSAPSAPVASTLPADIASFTGREGQLAELSALSERAGLALVAGNAGAGKTALAVHWGQSVRELFPDGQLYINLRGFDRGEAVDPLEALGRLLLILGVAGDAVPATLDAAAELFRASTDGRRVLVVLDNAGTADQVRPLLPGSGCFTVVTSRSRMPGLVAVNDAQVLGLDALPREESIALLRRLLGDDAELGALARLCGDLPLALRIAAANLAGTGHTVDSYVAELGERDRLSMLAVEGDADATVSATLDLSYDALGDARGLFCRIGALPGEDFSADLVVAISGLEEATATRLLRHLATSHLVEEYKPGRYRMHDLVRLYAAARAGTDLGEAERDAVVDAYIDWHYTHRFKPDVDDELNVLAAADSLDDRPRLWRMLLRLSTSLNHNRFVARAQAALRRGLEGCERRDHLESRFALTNLLASAAKRLGDADEGLALGYRTVELAEGLGLDSQASANGNLGMHLVNVDHRRAEIHLTKAVELAAESGHTRFQVLHGLNVTRIRTALGKFETATRHVEAVEQANAETLSPVERGRFGMVRVYTLLDQWRNDEALAEAERMIDFARESADQRLEAYLLTLVAETQSRLGRGRESLAAMARSIEALDQQRMVMLLVRQQLAASHVTAGEPDKALEQIAAGRREHRQILAYDGASLHRVEATAHRALGRLDEALEHALLAERGFRGIAALVKQVEALHLTANILVARGDTEEAERHRATASDIVAEFEPGLRVGALRAV
ncbi:BTAD domain-containing putative transcriptional regulator [Phytomonospora sp. NPDC050363]|uniref:BTAD domain-containing putative transcriptional regulator n=1 Tax=Phytomonospora sp. NPDC050363 TaxID=3155642 RepID=UPI0033EBDE7E